MSEFKSYVNRFDEYAREVFREVEETTKALKDAEVKRKAHPMKPGLAPEAAAKAARIEETYQRAKRRLDEMQKRIANEAGQKIEEIRKELAVSIEKTFTMNPADLDRDVLTILESGILTEADYSTLMQNSTTPTMRRLIAKYAHEEAIKAENSGDSSKSRNLRMIARTGKEDGSSYLAAFDSMRDTFSRTVRNNALIPHWEQLTAPIINSF